MTANWSTHPYFPNNAYPIASSDYAAVIDAAGNYTATLDSRDITVDSLLLNAAGATLAQSGYTLTSASTIVSAGTSELGTGTELSGGTLAVTSGGEFDINQGSFNGMTLTDGTTVNLYDNPANFFSSQLVIYNRLQSPGAATINLAMSIM